MSLLLERVLKGVATVKGPPLQAFLQESAAVLRAHRGMEGRVAFIEKALQSRDPAQMEKALDLFSYRYRARSWLTQKWQEKRSLTAPVAGRYRDAFYLLSPHAKQLAESVGLKIFREADTSRPGDVPWWIPIKYPREGSQVFLAVGGREAFSFLKVLRDSGNFKGAFLLWKPFNLKHTLAARGTGWIPKEDGNGLDVVNRPGDQRIEVLPPIMEKHVCTVIDKNKGKEESTRFRTVREVKKIERKRARGKGETILHLEDGTTLPLGKGETAVKSGARVSRIPDWISSEGLVTTLSLPNNLPLGSEPGLNVWEALLEGREEVKAVLIRISQTGIEADKVFALVGGVPTQVRGGLPLEVVQLLKAVVRRLDRDGLPSRISDTEFSRPYDAFDILKTLPPKQTVGTSKSRFWNSWIGRFFLRFRKGKGL